MRRTMSSEDARRAARLRARSEAWRSSPSAGARMAPELWSDAVELARHCGTYATAGALGVPYGSLLRHVTAARGERAGGGARDGAPSGAAFVEVSGAALLSSAGTVVEWSGADGTRLTIRLAAGHEIDVAGLLLGLQARGQ